jgi:hypothetical protein
MLGLESVVARLFHHSTVSQVYGRRPMGKFTNILYEISLLDYNPTKAIEIAILFRHGGLSRRHGWQKC